MPIYEYRCNDCRYKFERLQAMNGDSPAECPRCRAQQSVRRQFSIAAIRPNGIAPSGSDAPALHNTGNRARRLWMNPDGTTKEQSEWRPAFDGDPGRQVG